MREIDISHDLETLLESEFTGLHSGGGRSSIASVLSPYIRHNLLTLKQVWDQVAKAPYEDREKFRDELLWQEYARHLYARIGTMLFSNLRFEQSWDRSSDGWPQGFARWQVEKRVPQYCRTCPLNKNCPIQEFPQEVQLFELESEPLLNFDPNPDSTTGPLDVARNRKPTSALLAIESLGDHDPALSANPELPAVFVFNEPALAKLQLSSKRIFFYLETLQDLALRREVQVFIGDPVQYAAENYVAATYAPVPSFAKFQNLAELHPYLWLRTPHAHSVRSFSSWRNKLGK